MNTHKHKTNHDKKNLKNNQPHSQTMADAGNQGGDSSFPAMPYIFLITQEKSWL